MQTWEQRLETEWCFHVVMSSSVLGAKGDMRVIYSLSEISPMTHSVPDRCQTAAWTATVGELRTSTAELKENRLSYVVEQFFFWSHFPLEITSASSYLWVHSRYTELIFQLVASFKACVTSFSTALSRGRWVSQTSLRPI